ncbi:TrlF family AAA-like ATPase [Lactiplantibacillus plantarum]|uniref:TrlF family AAA-like ATPase n=1 Tax=Lactiplantibacillus plantarum TaxID=1590 RepID=UPI000697DD77|nr:AAA family ATPase [Lactiplantibacillus plantarum]MCW0154584.1 AAA family ATPase [Lactiplantibacillus plantarum]
MLKYAKFYKCALQVNPCSYAKYRGETTSDEDSYNRELVSECEANKIKVIGLADHESITSSEKLRTTLQEHGILVFPGFEITSSEHIHIICLFSNEISTDKLKSNLNYLMNDPNVTLGTAPSRNNFSTIMHLVCNELHGFAFAAHVTGDNGILKRGQTSDAWKSEDFRVAQIPAGIDQLDPKYKNIIKNTDVAYKRESSIVFINAKDIEKPTDLKNESASFRVKMSKISFSSFKMAFSDPQSRIILNSEYAKVYPTYIDSIKVTGGYLDGLAFDLSKSLNTLIGGRGTGKSTLISLIRYALDDEPSDDANRKDLNEIIRNNMGVSGVVTLGVKSSEQLDQSYTVKRRFEQDPVILDQHGNIVNLKVKDIIPNIEIYGQNEIMSIVGNSDRKREVVDRLIKVSKDTIVKIKDCNQAISNNSNEIQKLLEKQDSNAEKLTELPKIESQYETLTKQGITDKLKSFTPFVTQQATFDFLESNISSYKISLPKMGGTDELSSLHVKTVNNEITEFNTFLKTEEDKINSKAKALYLVYKSEFQNWAVKKNEADSKIKKVIESLPDFHDRNAQEIATLYQEVIQQKAQLEPLRSKQATISKKLHGLRQDRLNLIEDYKSVLDEKNSSIEKQIKKLNKHQLRGKLRLEIQPQGNIRKLLDYLGKLKGIGDAKLRGIADQTTVDVFTFTNNIRTGDVVKLMDTYNLTKVTAETLLRLTESQLLEIEDIRLTDIAKIQLFVGGKFKDIESLSKGQQCTAILDIIMLDNKDPLIVDQPEDNLDNSFITNNLVDGIRHNKNSRQYIFATHNANIPVFGDAELIATLHEVDGQGEVENSGVGSIDDENVKKNVINILEGGAKAFRMRESKYNIEM